MTVMKISYFVHIVQYCTICTNIVQYCTICTKYGKRGETGNLKKLALEMEHEIEREFI